VIHTCAVVATKKRHSLVRDMLRTIDGQVGGVVVVDNNDTPDPIAEDEFTMAVLNVHYPCYPPNISELLNVGLDKLYTPNAPTEWNVVLLNDDVLCPQGWVESLSGAMRATTAVMAYTDRQGRPEPVLYTQSPATPHDAATVWACMLRGERRLRFDESMKWWYSDTDLDFYCRQVGGVLAVPGPLPEHLHPSEQTLADPVLTAQTHRDRERFNQKWNGVPW
jgi:hypothetical protein